MSVKKNSDKIKTFIWAVYFAVCILSSTLAFADENVLTFFGWSDQHVKVDGDGEHLMGAIDAMNKLPGRAYPAQISGKVDEPNFVMGLGDISEWPSAAARDTYERLITKRLRFRSFDVAGNHDSGGLSPSPIIHDWLVKRYGALSYTFDKKGVHFVSLYSKYDESLNNPAQPIAKDALEYLRKDLAKVPTGTPVVVATHLCFDAITNRDEFIDAFGNANVILILAGHYHKATVNKYRDVNFVQLPSPAPDSAREVTVIRINSESLVAIPFDYEKDQWCADPKKILDVKIRGPRAKEVPGKPKQSQERIEISGRA